MPEIIYSPLRDYREQYRDKFVEAANRAFTEFADAAKVDEAANRETCASIRHYGALVSKASTSLGWWWALFVALLVGAAVTCGLWLAEIVDVIVPIAVAVAVVLLEILWVYPKISKLKKHKRQLEAQVEKLTQEAYAQMEPLNSLYDDEIFHRLVHEVIPIVQLDPYLKSAKMQFFADDFGWRPDNRPDAAAVNVQSGSINGNPFMICRRLLHHMGTKTYTGSKTVTVYKTRIVNGKSQTYTTVETLTASVTKPFPEYAQQTEIVYGNQAAPELTFSRRKNKFKNKEGSLSYKFNEWKLRRKAAKMDRDFALMTNEEFEVLFTTSDRNNNQQYALLFTPMAQANMIDLIRDEEQTGYGDDFDFRKSGRINTVTADHMQAYNLDWSPRGLRLYEFEKAREAFVNRYLEAFKGLYFALAPLLSIPLYQQMRPGDDVRMHRPLDAGSDTLQHEVLAYYWGVDNFRNPACVTDCILKTNAERRSDGSSLVNVTAYGYRSVPRVDYITRYDSNGRRHSVPVQWDEYLPVQGNGSFCVQETGDYPAEITDPLKRKEYDAERLRKHPGAALFRQIATWPNQ